MIWELAGRTEKKFTYSIAQAILKTLNPLCLHHHTSLETLNFSD